MAPKRVILGAIVLVAAVIAVYLFTGKAHVEATKISVRLAWIPGVTFIGDYVAQDQGYWKSRGLDVKVEPGGFELDAIKLVAAGADTIGVTSGPQFVQARASGVPIVALASTIPKSPIGWISKADSGIKTPQDFKGHRVGSQFGTHTEITLEAMMARLDIPLSSFERIAVKFDPRPFVVGEIDVLPVYLIDQPVDLEAQGIKLNRIDPGDYGAAFDYGNIYFTTEKNIKEMPQTIKAFLEGASEGWSRAESNRPAALDILYTRVETPDAAILTRKLDEMFAFITKDGAPYPGLYPVTLDGLNSIKEILVTYGGLTSEVDVDSAVYSMK
ncbi:MAG: ABC transporter substrate-binding protein [Rhodospirillales bacterium]